MLSNWLLAESFAILQLIIEVLHVGGHSLNCLPTQIATRLVARLLRSKGNLFRAIRVGLDGEKPRLAVKVELEPSLGQIVKDNHPVIWHRWSLIVQDT